jgi:phage replication O-like protein O
MANPQIENGHIDIATEIVDKLCSYRLSGQEWQIIWVILRKTWGWLTEPKNRNSPKKKMDRIALSQFEQLTGIDRRKCHVLLKKLITKKVIKKTITQKGDRTDITYGFQKNFDLWKVSPKKVTVIQKGDRVSPKKVSKLSPKKMNTKDILKETITKDIKKIIKRKTLFPDNYNLEKKHIDYANSKGITDNLDDIFEGFCINHRKRGTQFVDWYAAWQTWIRNKIKWDKEKQGVDDDKYNF